MSSQIDFFPNSPLPSMTVLPPSSEAEEDQLLQSEDEDEEDQDPDVFRVTGALKEPEYKQFTTKKLHEMIHNSEINLDPPWQRDVVWTQPKQSSLVNSIFTNYPIPPIVLAWVTEVDDDGEEERVLVCVDGKQRLTSVLMFMEGRIHFKDKKNPNRWFYNALAGTGAKRMQMPPQAKAAFDAKKLSCVIYQDLAPGVERDMFQRVQLGVSLTTAENLQSIDSPYSTWIGNLVMQHVTSDNGLEVKLSWDTKRGRPFQNVAMLVYCCENEGDEVIPSVASRVDAWIRQERQPPDHFKKKINNVLNEMWALATDAKHSKIFEYQKKRIAPVEFVFMGVMLYVLSDLSLDRKARALYNLRVGVRESHRDIRMNTAVGKTMWSIINKTRDNPSKLLKSSSSKGKKRRRAEEDDDEDEDEFPPEKPKPSTSRAGPSKKRRAEEDDDDDEFPPSPEKPTRKTRRTKVERD